MLKVITGPPRAGKTYWAVRHVLMTYFKWDDDLFTWIPKDANKFPLVLTNIDGLRVPHIQLEQFLAKRKQTLPEFLTLDQFVPFIESEGKNVVLLLDEAHGTFPYNFKDKGAGNPNFSTLYFFGYHGHYPVDIYLITHSWTDLCQSIAQRAEYQIDGDRRTMSTVGEFRYFYLHPKTQDKLNTQIVKSDKRVHMMYLSSSGEHKSNEIRPMRRALALALAAILVTVVSCTYFLKHYGSPAKKEAKAPRPPVGAGAGALPSVAPVTQLRPPTVPPRLTPEALARQTTFRVMSSALKPPTIKKQSYVQVSLSGAWFDGKMVSVDLFGDVVPLRDLPYSYTIDKTRRRALVMIPDDVVASLRPGLWVDNSRVLDRGDKPLAPPSGVPPLGTPQPVEQQGHASKLAS